MTSDAHPPSGDLRQLLGTFGFWAMVCGSLAILLVAAQIALPMMEPKAPVGTQIGEIAGDIRRAAWRSFFGLKPEPVEPQAMPFVAYFALATPAFGVGAIVLAAVAGFLRESRHIWGKAALLGFSAIVFQVVWWVAIVVAGVVLLVAILNNIGDIFSF